MFQPITPRNIFFSFFILFITSCSSHPITNSPLLYTETFLPSTAKLALTATPTETLTPQVSTFPNTIATQFCMGSIALWSCTCGELFNDDLYIREAADVGSCDVIMPQRYRITLPESWYCSARGVFAHNLSCLTADGQRIFIRSVVSDLPLANADESIHILREGEGTFSEPVVEPGEEQVEREILTIGQKQTLSLLTRQNDDTFALRYFIKNNENLYVFIVESEDLDEVNGMAVLLEAIIDSIQFIK